MTFTPPTEATHYEPVDFAPERYPDGFRYYRMNPPAYWRNDHKEWATSKLFPNRIAQRMQSLNQANPKPQPADALALTVTLDELHQAAIILENASEFVSCFPQYTRRNNSEARGFVSGMLHKHAYHDPWCRRLTTGVDRGFVATPGHAQARINALQLLVEYFKNEPEPSIKFWDADRFCPERAREVNSNGFVFVLTHLQEPLIKENSMSFDSTHPVKENLVSTKPSIIKIESVVRINGQDANEFKNEQLYALIREQELAVTELEKITARPKSLTKEIEDRKAGIAALVEFMDKRDEKA